MNNAKVLHVKAERLFRTKKRVRARVAGTAARPRLAVSRSLKSMYAQLIDDEKGVTLAAASTKHLDEKQQKLNKSEQAFALGKLIADKAKVLSVTKVVYDRGGRLYHGRVLRLAEGAREGGLDF